ncbi:MAG: hypothetical protein ACXVHS_08865 [Methanobacterium sp.]
MIIKFIGSSALIYACSKGHFKIINLLLSAGAFVNSTRVLHNSYCLLSYLLIFIFFIHLSIFLFI